MQIEILNTHKKYKHTYCKIDNQVYTAKQAKQIFGEQFEDGLNEQNSKTDGVLKKIYKYPTKKTMQQKVNEKAKTIFNELNLKKTTNVYENYKTANDLMYYVITNTNIDMTIIEDRLLNLKNLTDELKQNTKQIEKAYSKQVYNKDKEYKKTKSLLKRLEKQTKNQQLKMLFNVLVRNKSTNQEDINVFFKLLQDLNIKTYKASLTNKENNLKYLLALVPIKLKKNDATKYYFYDLTKYRHELKQVAQKNNKESIKLFGKADLKNLYKDYEVVSFESDTSVLFKDEAEFNKVFKQISNDSIQTSYTI